jgi:very-short-patch-repair endonuclease
VFANPRFAMPPKGHRVRPTPQNKAGALRSEPTTPEQLLWSRLRSKRLAGWRFRRQVPIDRFVVDFFCPTAQLVVELDAPTPDDRQGYDAARAERLAEGGLRVVRYTNDEVLRDLDAVVQDITRHLHGPTAST